MRHHTAAPLADGSGYHYASVHRSGGYPLGYCAEHAPHPTDAEARVCYRRWQRDNVEPNGTWSWGSCHAVTDAGDDPATPKRCDNPARNGWHIRGDGYALAVLCDDHNDREHALTALHLDDDHAGDSWQS